MDRPQTPDQLRAVDADHLVLGQMLLQNLDRLRIALFRSEGRHEARAVYKQKVDIRRRQPFALVPDRLVSRVEIAALLGVSTQRVHQLLGRADFPEPVAELAIGKVWDRTMIEAWARATGRLDADGA